MSFTNIIMEIRNQYSRHTFQARTGKQLTKLVRKEFGGDETKVIKFENLFNSAHNNLDTNTVIDIDKKGRYVFSNTSFPNIAYCHEQKLVKIPLSEAIIAECHRTFAYGQLLLFRNIVKVLSERNIPLEEIEKIGLEKITHPKAGETFMKIIQTAKWMRENMPQLRLNQINFEVADNQMSAEKLSKNRKDLGEYNNLSDLIAKMREIIE